MPQQTQMPYDVLNSIATDHLHEVRQKFFALTDVLKTEYGPDIVGLSLERLLLAVAVAIRSGLYPRREFTELWEFCAAMGHTQRPAVNEALRALGASIPVEEQ